MTKKQLQSTGGKVAGPRAHRPHDAYAPKPKTAAMTDRKSALQELLAKVEAGEAEYSDFQAACYALEGYQGRAQEAYEEGCRTAAHVVHDALVPKWTRDVDATAPEAGTDVSLWSPTTSGDDGRFTSTHEIEAVAHLLSILKVLIAEADQ